MSQDEVAKRLKAPFNYNEIEWRILNTTQDKSRGLAVPYVDSRAIQNRLDTAVGAFNWRNEYHQWQTGAQLCGISVYDEVREVWVTKFDGAECGDIEPVKSGISDSFKRAAVHWNIGRYLYQFDAIWCDIEPRGKSLGIKQDQYSKLEAEYNKAVTRIFGVTNNENQSNISSDSVSNQTQPTPPPIDNIPSVTDLHNFTVKTVKPSGKSSQVLELVDKHGEVIRAYIKASNQAISSGSCLSQVQMERKQSSYGEYNLINAYQIAA